MLRLNSYARKAGMSFNPGEIEAANHVNQFLTTVNDQALVRQFFGTMDIESLSEKMQRFRILERNLGVKTKVYSGMDTGVPDRKANPQPGVNKFGGRHTFPFLARASKHYMVNHDIKPGVMAVKADEDYETGMEEEFDEEMLRFQSEEDQEEDGEQVFAVQEAHHEGQEQPMPAVCPKCNRGRHAESDCFRNRQCQLCKRYGHTSDRCLFVCKVCMLVQRRGQLHVPSIS